MHSQLKSLRLTPPAPFLEREVLQDDTLSGYHIPAGVVFFFSHLFLTCTVYLVQLQCLHLFPVHDTQTVVSVFIMGASRDPTVWKNPTIFDPDRWY